MKKIIYIFILFTLTFSLFSLEIADGRMKVVFHESTGRFSVYYLDDATLNKFVPMFLDKDPRTTTLNVLVGNKVYTMGSSATFKQTVEKNSDGASYIWTSPSLIVTQRISFIKSKGAILTDGIKINISMNNVSDSDLYVGIRYLFDTVMGEEGKTHFKTDTLTKVANETDYTVRMPKFWVSPSSETATPGLQVMTSGYGITVPDRVVFANWSRLNDSSWTFTSKTSRNFNYLPYSINDSAVCHFYNPQNIISGGIAEVVLVMGSYVNDGYSLEVQNVSSDVSDIYEQVVSTDTEGDEVLSVKKDLAAVSDLLKEIDLMLASEEEVSEEELNLIREILLNLKQRKTKY